MKVLSLFLTFAALFSVPGAVLGQDMHCNSRDMVTAVLASQYGEELVGIGIEHRGSAFELWANRETGTFTVLATDPGGIACVAAHGGDWQAMAQGDPA